MIRTITHDSTHGTITLRFEAFGGLKHELGDDAFAAWIDEQSGTAMMAVGAYFNRLLNELVSETGPQRSPSRYNETIEINCDGTTVKVALELHLKVKLTARQRAELVGEILAAIRGHLANHLDDKPKKSHLEQIEEIFGKLDAASLFGTPSPFAQEDVERVSALLLNTLRVHG